MTSTLCLLLVVSCGDDDDGTQAGPTPEPTATAVDPALTAALVTTQEIDEEPETSPQRRFLEWWQAMQYRDVNTAAEMTEAEDERAERRFRAAVLAVGAGFGHPRIQDAEVEGGEATVRVLIDDYGPDGAVAARTPYTFEMLRVEDSWRVVGGDFVTGVARDVREAREDSG